MESFLKYLRGSAVAGSQRAPVTIAASACEDGGGGGEVEDDASFFDLEFAVPGDETDAEEERVEFNFDAEVDDAVAGGESERKEATAEESSEVAAPPPPPPRPATTRFRVLLLKLRKQPNNNKVGVPPALEVAGAAAKSTGNRFLIKFRTVDDAPLVSLFTRDNSSRTSDADMPPAVVQQAQDSSAVITAEERRFAKEVVLKYLNKIKPLYVKVSRRYGERLRFPGGEGEETDAEPEASSSSPAASPAPSSSQDPAPAPVVVACGVRAPRASVPAGLKQVCKRLGKSRSASSAVTPNPAAVAASSTVERRDDSLLQLQDGIQSAIAHCKRSFNASKGCESPLLRSVTADTSRAADTSDGAS